MKLNTDASPAGLWNRAALGLIAESLNAKSAGGPLSAESVADLADELADDEFAFAVIDDYEARRDVNVADERAALVDLFAVNGLIDDADPSDHGAEIRAFVARFVV